VPGNEVPAEARGQRQRLFQVHAIADPKVSQRRHAQTLTADIGGKTLAVERGDGQADAVHGDRVT
jgi:hypothetical protein